MLGDTALLSVLPYDAKRRVAPINVHYHVIMIIATIVVYQLQHVYDKLYLVHTHHSNAESVFEILIKVLSDCQTQKKDTKMNLKQQKCMWEICS